VKTRAVCRCRCHVGATHKAPPSLSDPIAALTACDLCAPMHAEVIRTVPTPRRTRTRQSDVGAVWPLDHE
jgi:hypothetical protein